MKVVQVIADEIHADGQLVAIIVPDLPATVHERFIELLDAMSPDTKPPADLLGELEEKARASSRSGLLRMSDLAIIIARLKEAK